MLDAFLGPGLRGALPFLQVIKHAHTQTHKTHNMLYCYMQFNNPDNSHKSLTLYGQEYTDT